METSASVSIDTREKVLNLMIACDAVAESLRKEGRHVTALDVWECVDHLAFALTRYDQVAGHHD